MNYDIKILAKKGPEGAIEFDRLGIITKTTKEIALKSFMLKYRGYSDLTPDRKIRKALAIRLEKLSTVDNEETSLLIDCDYFKDAVKELQLDAFRDVDELLSLTPMALVINSFRAALTDKGDLDNLDKPLLKSLMKFKRSFEHDDEVFSFSNRNTIPEIEIRKQDFKKIENLEESIPEPKKVMVNGMLDEMKISKSKLGLITSDGNVNLFVTEKSLLPELREYLGREVTISGTAHFKPNGTVSFIQVDEYSEPGETDKVFNRKPRAMGTEQQVLFQLKAGKKQNPLNDLIGSWPGDESLDELLEMLD